MTKISEEQCVQIVQKSLGSLDFKVNEIKLNQFHNLNGFMGQYYNLQIEVEIEKEKKTYIYFVKNIPSGHIETFIKETGFPHESFLYTEYQKKLHQINVTCLDDLIPKCYLVENGEFIVLEDLAQLGYKSQSIRTPYNIETLRMVTKALSKFHASSLLSEEIFTECRGEEFRWNKEYSDILTDLDLKSNQIFMNMGAKTVNLLIDMFPEVCKDLSIDEFKKRGSIVFEENLNLMTPTKKFRNALCHGDMWGANILFAKDDNGTYTDCKLIDFQFLKYHIPAQDLLMFLYTSTDRETRLKYTDELIDMHYKEIRKIFESYGRQFDSIYTREEFIESYKFIKPLALGQAIIYNQTNLVSSEKMRKIREDPELNEIIGSEDRKAFLEEVLTDEVHKARVTESLEDFYEVCLGINLN